MKITIFGLTGGIACGKSTVSKTFRKHGIPMVDADVIARQVVEVGSHGYFLLLKSFGRKFFQEDGSLDRAKFGNYVFENADAMRKLNNIMGPLIREESTRQINRWLNYSIDAHEATIIGYDAALICEMGNASRYHPLIVVSCPQDTQVERLMSRNSLTREQAMARIASQMPVAQKAALADYVIDTSDSIENSIKQTENIIQILKGKV